MFTRESPPDSFRHISKNQINIIGMEAKQKPINANVNEIANFNKGLIKLSVGVGLVIIDVFIIFYLLPIKSSHVLKVLASQRFALPAGGWDEITPF